MNINFPYSPSLLSSPFLWLMNDWSSVDEFISNETSSIEEGHWQILTQNTRVCLCDVCDQVSYSNEFWNQLGKTKQNLNKRNNNKKQANRLPPSFCSLIVVVQLPNDSKISYARSNKCSSVLFRLMALFLGEILLVLRKAFWKVISGKLKKDCLLVLWGPVWSLLTVFLIRSRNAPFCK